MSIYERWRPYLFLVFVIITFLTFGQALVNEYTYDGKGAISRVAGEEPAPFAVLLDSDRYGTATGVMSWRPLTVASFMALDVRAFNQFAPLSHALNLLLHAANAYLLFVIICRFLPYGHEERQEWLALLTSALFLVHPLTTEVVYCAGFRFDLFALFFVLLTLWAAQGWSFRAGPWPRNLLLVILAFIPGLLAKEIAVVAMFLVPLGVLILEEDKKKALILSLALLIFFGLFFVIWRQFQYADYSTEFLGGQGRLLGIGNFTISAVEIYLQKLFVPWPLRIDYNFQPVESWNSTRLLGSLAVVAVLAVGALLLAWRDRFCAFGLIWIVVAFGPVSQILPIPDPVAERFTYVPMAGLAIFLFGVCRLFFGTDRRPIKPLLTAAAVVLLVLAGISHARGLQWRDDLTLNLATWEAATEETPRVLRFRGALNLMSAGQDAENGRARAAMKHREAAREALEKLLDQDPEHAEGRRLLALYYLQTGEPETARHHLRRGLEAAPENAELQELARRLEL